ncbi:MAG: helix-turn-helix domain-containing protein [Nitrospira defluvii]|nr:helix-turn-helix domain-containing protein [Nitrospira defluvii]
MSIKVLGMVWKGSGAKGGDLLVALAIADFADDDGNAYPSIPTLGKKSRLSDRQVKRAIQNLESLGELKILRGKGPCGTNRYKLRGDILSRVNLSWGVTNEAAGGDICDRWGVTPMSPNPSEETVTRSRVQVLKSFGSHTHVKNPRAMRRRHGRLSSRTSSSKTAFLVR